MTDFAKLLWRPALWIGWEILHIVSDGQSICHYRFMPCAYRVGSTVDRFLVLFDNQWVENSGQKPQRQIPNPNSKSQLLKSNSTFVWNLMPGIWNFPNEKLITGKKSVIIRLRPACPGWGLIMTGIFQTPVTRLSRSVIPWMRKIKPTTPLKPEIQKACLTMDNATVFIAFWF